MHIGVATICVSRCQPFGNSGPDRPVDHARGEDALLRRAALALEEAAGDLPGRVHPLLDVHRKGEEVDVADVAGRRGAEHHGVAGADDYGAACLLGKLAGLEADLGARDVHRGTVN